MITLKCLSQGSIGNCYILDCDGEMLVIDAGVDIKTLKKGIDYNLYAVQGICVTHTHKDHSRAVDDLRGLGLSVFTPFTVDQRAKTFGHYRIQAFPVPHNETPCFAFFIKINDRRIVYATDLEYCPFSMAKQNLTDIIIECNYQDKYLNKDAENLNHKVIGHCELQTTKAFVAHNVTPSLQNVILTHLGVETCNGNECVDEIKTVVPDSVNIDYAQAGKSWILTN